MYFLSPLISAEWNCFFTLAIHQGYAETDVSVWAQCPHKVPTQSALKRASSAPWGSKATYVISWNRVLAALNTMKKEIS